MTMSPVLGSTGAPLDPVSAGYVLGNGYRLYLPGLMRFSAPDASSPFEEGGMNAYVYCGSSPVTRADPSGHGFFDILNGFMKGVETVFDYTSPAWLLVNKVIPSTPEWLKTTTKVLQNVAQDVMFTALAVATAIPTGGASLTLLASVEIGSALTSGGLAVASDIMSAFKGGGIEKATQITGYASAGAGFGAGVSRTTEALVRPMMDVSFAKDAVGGLTHAAEEGGEDPFRFSGKVNSTLGRRFKGAAGMVIAESAMNSPVVAEAFSPPPPVPIPTPPSSFGTRGSSFAGYPEPSGDQGQSQSRLLISSPLM